MWTRLTPSSNDFILLVPNPPASKTAAAPAAAPAAPKAAAAPVQQDDSDDGPAISITRPPGALPVAKAYFAKAAPLPDVVTSAGTLQAGSTFAWPLNHDLTIRLARLTTTGVSFTTIGAQDTLAGATTTLPANVPAHYERLPDTLVSDSFAEVPVPGHYEQGPSAYQASATTPLPTTVPAYYSQGRSIHHRATWFYEVIETTVEHCMTMHMLEGGTEEWCWDTTTTKSVRVLDEDAWDELTQVYHPASTITGPTDIPSGSIIYQGTPDNYWMSSAYTAQPSYSTTAGGTLLTQVYVPYKTVNTPTYIPSGYIVNPGTVANSWVSTSYMATPVVTAGWVQVNKVYVPATIVSTPTLIPAGEILFEGTPNNTWVSKAYTATPTTTTGPDQTRTSEGGVTSGGTVTVISATFSGVRGSHKKAPHEGKLLEATELHSFHLSDDVVGSNDLSYNVVAMITWADGHVETRSYPVVLHITNITTGLK